MKRPSTTLSAPNAAYPRFAEQPACFISELSAGNSVAVEYLFAKISGIVGQIARSSGLAGQDVEEVLHDTAIIFIQKIRDGKYQLTDYKPQSYAIAIARRVVQNYAAKQRLRRIAPAEVEILAANRRDEDSERSFAQLEQTEWLLKMLGQLPEKNRYLLELRFFAQLSDEEIIAQKLTHYTTIDSLKNRRKESLQKLRRLVAAQQADWP